MNESKSISKQQEKEVQPFCITYDELELLLNTFETQKQIQQLKELVKNHPDIDHNPSHGFFTGTGSIMKELRYLIQKYTHEITVLDSELDIEPSHQQSILFKRVVHGRSINITEGNFKILINHIMILTVLKSNHFQILYSDRQKETIKQEGSFNQILITNKCIENKKMFMIFEHIHQILELQSLIDEELPLAKFKPIFSHFQHETNNMSRSTIQEGKEIFFFRRRTEKDWDKFIHNININSGTHDALVMKFRHFDELVERKQLFNTHIKIVMDQDQIRLNSSEVSQLRIFNNEQESSHQLEELAIQLIRNGSKPFQYKDHFIDPITSFNIFLLEHKKVDELFLLEGGNEKEYVYFTFYKKMMEIIRDPDTKQFIRLTEKDQIQEIENKYYREAIEKIKKHAIINQLPFYILYQDANNITKVNRDQLTDNRTGDVLKLYAYQYLLNKLKYKIVVQEGQNEEEVINNYQKTFAIIFDKESKMFDKMGKMKSESIIKKVKIKEKNRQRGKMEAQSHFARGFIKKCLEELKFQ